MASNLPTHRLAQFFSGFAEQTFQAQLGVVDPPMVDYLSDLLLRFVRNEDVVPRGVTGKRLEGLSEMVGEATQRMGEAQRKIHCQIGDFALFWAGLFPESLRNQSTSQEDPFTDYVSQGKRAYIVASQIETEQAAAPPADLLRRLGDRFELCAYGLREVQREWEKQDDSGDPGPLLFN